MTALEPGFLVQGKFELLAELGRGGMGSVWRARDRRLGRDVAIKFISTRLGDGMEPERVTRVRFEREARAAAGLTTRHVVQIFEFGVDGDTPFLVMELLRGESLSARLRRVRAVSMEEAGALVTQIAIGLEVAHASGIVHRDLKPANVFLTETDGEEVVKILDFGIAKALEPDLDTEITDSNTIMGTPSYMAPEQVRRAADVDGRADVWSLGVILFRAITGVLPFPARSTGDLIAQIVSDPLPRASALLSEPAGPIDAFFERALARDRAARFGSPRELARAFAALLQASGRAAPSLPSRWAADSATPAPPASSDSRGNAFSRPPRPLPEPGDSTQASGTVYASSARAQDLLRRSPRRLAVAAAISSGVVLGAGTVLLSILRTGGAGDAAPASEVAASSMNVEPDTTPPSEGSAALGAPDASVTSGDELPGADDADASAARPSPSAPAPAATAPDATAAPAAGSAAPASAGRPSRPAAPAPRATTAPAGRRRSRAGTDAPAQGPRPRVGPGHRGRRRLARSAAARVRGAAVLHGGTPGR
ncbi:MAG: protein kinase [Polyangiaceae bacterium]